MHQGSAERSRRRSQPATRTARISSSKPGLQTNAEERADWRRDVDRGLRPERGSGRRGVGQEAVSPGRRRRRRAGPATENRRGRNGERPLGRFWFHARSRDRDGGGPGSAPSSYATPRRTTIPSRKGPVACRAGLHEPIGASPTFPTGLEGDAQWANDSGGKFAEAAAGVGRLAARPDDLAVYSLSGGGVVSTAGSEGGFLFGGIDLNDRLLMTDY
jgi:hypothetical protein